LRELGRMGKTILISSHILPELASVCDEVIIIERSRLLACGPIKKILAEVSQASQVQIELLNNAPAAAEFLKKIPLVSQVKVIQNLVQFDFQGDDAQAAQILRGLVSEGHSVCWMRQAEADLEDVFIRVTGRNRPAPAAAGAAAPAKPAAEGRK
ncbi:MAG TPA: hypothetical protein P5137_14335, partial [Candidatus Brocadiia bacterium]|nr:hypothetical protein [Candidatus Brocadiia bacterium]